MLENLDLDDLKAIADTLTALPGPHAWTHGIDDIFVCQACYVAFEFGADPVPEGPCEPVYPPIDEALLFSEDDEPAPGDPFTVIDDDEEPF